MRHLSFSRALGLIAALAAVVVLPAGAFARPRPHVARTHTISIQAIPNPIDAGDPLVIVGHLSGPGNANKTVNLFHRLPGQSRFSFVQSASTDANGNYAITRNAGVVDTNRAWVVRSLGVQSRVVHEGVHALITLSASPTNARSNQPVVFAGHVTPNHRGEVVHLQRQVGANDDDWRDIGGATGRLGPASNYRIVHRFKVPDADGFTVRAVIRRDNRNLQGASSSVDISVAQNQNPKFTINASADPIRAGGSVTLSGMLAAPNNANQTVTLFAHENGKPYAALASTTTDGSGNYSFMQSPLHTTAYQVRAAGGRKTAQVFEGVQDVVTLTVSSMTPTVGQVVSFTGTVAPDKTGHFIELQRRGRDGDFHTIQIVRVGSGSKYEFLARFARSGSKTLRVHINGGALNWGASSPPVTLNVQPGATPTTGAGTTS
ncbi:MAG: hypothetical protein QOK04_1933 [Solirubrobacteraceae bacterium]|nr:hypothetical protein [Solirubrobacteraceae bacterium]